MEPLMPPPIRRIVVDREPTIVAPPPRAPARRQRQTAAHRARRPDRQPRRRFRRRTGHGRRADAHRAAVDRLRRQAGRDDRSTCPVRQGEVLALIGPSGCGKTTLLRSLNRLVELTPTATRGGRITLDGEDVDALEVTQLRRRVSMVFQQPNPFPMSIFDNVAYALREQGSGRPRRERAARRPVVEALQRAGPATTRSPTNLITRRCGCPAASSSGCASRARWRRGPRCCCSTSPARRSTRARPRRSRS